MHFFRVSCFARSVASGELEIRPKADPTTDAAPGFCPKTMPCDVGRAKVSCRSKSRTSGFGRTAMHAPRGDPRLGVASGRSTLPRRARHSFKAGRGRDRRRSVQDGKDRQPSASARCLPLAMGPVSGKTAAVLHIGQGSRISQAVSLSSARMISVICRSS